MRNSIVILSLLCVSTLAHAHGIHAFATQHDGVIAGYAYYGSDHYASDAKVELSDTEGVIAQTTTNSEGEFSLAVPGHVHPPLTVVVTTPDGHRATCAIASEGDDHDHSHEAMEEHDHALPTESDVDHEELEHMLDTALHEHTEELQRSIDAYRNETKLHDIIGGLGYIVGVFGIIAFMKSRGKG